MRTFLSITFVYLSASAALALPQLSTGRIHGAGGGVWPDTPRNDPIIWDNGPPTNQNGYSSQNDTVYPFNSQTADDFTLARQQGAGNGLPFLVTDVHWAGVYWCCNINVPEGFNIMFYANDPTAPKSPTGRGLPDPRPTALLDQFVPLAASNETFAAAPAWYTYDAKLQVPFLADRFTKYWIGIQAELVFGPQWGWTTSPLQDDNPAQQGFPLIGLPYWSAVNGGEDVTFRLSGFQIPEPTGLALLALGGLALIRRRAPSARGKTRRM